MPSNSSPLHSHLATLPEYSTPRAQFLYSSLPPRRTANPTGYSGAIQWWRRTFVDLVSKGLLGHDKLILDAKDDLREQLRWQKIGRPLSLGTVIAELATSGDYVRLEDYLAGGGGEAGRSSWGSLLARPLWWGYSKVFGSSEAGEGADEKEWIARKGDWVIKELVERAVVNLRPHLTDLHADALSRLYTIKTFQTVLGPLCLPDVVLSERDCSVLAKRLSALGLCTVQGEVIKFAPPLSSSSAPLITPSDHGILTLQSTLTSLNTYITTIESRITSEQALATSYHAKKQLNLVKSHLIARKRLESLLAQRVASRDKLSEVLMGIEKATGDEETMAALTLGTKTLRTLISSPTLSLDHVEATTSALSDALADADDISRAVDAVGGEALDADMEEEVEGELKELIEADKREEEMKVRAEEIERSQRESEKRDGERREEEEGERKKVEEEKKKREEEERKRVEESERRLEKEKAPVGEVAAKEAVAEQSEKTEDAVAA